MNSVIKIVIGIVVGGVGTWFFLKPAPLSVTSGAGSKESTQQEQGSGPASSASDPIEQDNQQFDTETSENVELDSKETLKVKVQNLQAALREKEMQLVTERQSKKSALSKLEQLAGEEGAIDTSGSASENKYLSDIPEDYHQLLDPPERRKDLPELHRDLVEEEQDLNWGLGMEQQIKSFVMNHPHSNYLLDFRVTCKTTMCEMMSKIPVEHTKKWSDLCNDMRKEGWWEFRGTSISGTNTDDKKNYVNIRLMTRKQESEPDNAET